MSSYWTCKSSRNRRVFCVHVYLRVTDQARVGRFRCRLRAGPNTSAVTKLLSTTETLSS